MTIVLFCLGGPPRPSPRLIRLRHNDRWVSFVQLKSGLLVIFMPSGGMSTTRVSTEQSSQSRKGRGPSPTKTAATRQALAAAGLAAFMESGFAGTRMSDVAARAGVAKGTAYLHFEDKAALFSEVLRRFVLDAAGGRTIGRPHPGEATYAFLRRTLLPIVQEIQASDGFRVLYLVIAEGARFPELADIYRTVAIDPVLRLTRVYARRAEARGEIPRGTISCQPVLLAAPMVLGAVWNNLFGRGDPLDVASMLDSFLNLTLCPGNQRVA